MYREKPPFLRRYLVTFIIVTLALIIRLLLQSISGDDTTFTKNMSVVIFLFSVILSAGYGGLGTGIFATILSLVAMFLISLTPEQTFSLALMKDQLRLVFFLFFGCLISILYETVQQATRWRSIVLGSISDIFITCDRNMRFIYVNKKAEEIFRIRRDTVLGKRILDVYPEAKKMRLYRNFHDAFRRQKRMQFELQMDQGRRWYAVSLYPTPDGISAYFQDITRRKRIERRLRESQLQFRRLFDANIIGIFTADAEGNVYEANDMFLKTVGYTRSDLKYRRINWKHMTPPEYQGISDRTNREVLRKGMSPPFEKEYIRKDGHRVNILMGKVLLNKTTGTILTFNLDITEQKNLEQKKNEFISIASHELKTPLTTVKAFTQILLRQENLRKDKRSSYFLESIDAQVNRLNLLISDLLDVSKIEAGRLSFTLKDVVIDELVKNVIVDFQYTTQSHVIVKEGASHAVVSGDEHRLEQVLINLISNAVKYSPDAEQVIVRLHDEKDKVVVSIQDFGIGIPADEQERVFERFFRSEKQKASDVAGFGLGLFITKEIIDRHGGKLWLESKEGKGSTFSFSLPLLKKKVKTKK